jgi:hypothetical protein
LRRRVRVPCELWIARRRHAATLLDATARGLSVRTEADLEEGATLRVVLEFGRGAALDLEAVVWSRRRVAGGAGERRLGLMVIRAPEDLPRRLGLAVEAPEHPAPRRAPQERVAAAPDPAPHRYCVRVGQCAGSRTRWLTLAAASEEAAGRSALEALEDSWRVLEVRRVA